MKGGMKNVPIRCWWRVRKMGRALKAWPRDCTADGKSLGSGHTMDVKRMYEHWMELDSWKAAKLNDSLQRLSERSANGLTECDGCMSVRMWNNSTLTSDEKYLANIRHFNCVWQSTDLQNYHSCQSDWKKKILPKNLINVQRARDINCIDSTLSWSLNPLDCTHDILSWGGIKYSQRSTFVIDL